jgi:hypothetical protein
MDGCGTGARDVGEDGFIDAAGGSGGGELGPAVLPHFLRERSVSELSPPERQ